MAEYPHNFAHFVADVVKTWYHLDSRADPEIYYCMRTWAYSEHGNRNASKALVMDTEV